MWLKSEKFILVPKTVYEIRREMRVRETRQTCIAHERRYYDVDTGKFNLDKMNKIESYSLSDSIDWGADHRQFYYKYIPRFNKKCKIKTNAIVEPKTSNDALIKYLPASADEEVIYQAYLTKREAELWSLENDRLLLHERAKIGNLCNVRPNNIRHR